MTRALWLHCGAFKSGSSGIQREVWGRREELRARGWLYPESGLVTDEPEVGHRHSRLVYRFAARGEWQSMVDALVAEIQQAGLPRILMSSEAWSRPGPGAEALAALLGELTARAGVDDVHAVLYLRNRYAYARSLYRELTRRRDNRLTLPDFVAAHPALLDPLRPVRRLQDVVGRERLRVVPYEEVGDTVAHFFGLLGIQRAPDQQLVNRGQGAVEVEAHRQLKLLAPELRDHFPGLGALWPDHHADGGPDPLARYAERFGPGQLASPASWRREFAATTGWTDAQVDRLTRPPPAPRHDVTELSAALRAAALRWLEAACTPYLQQVAVPHPELETLELETAVTAGGAVRLSGRVLWRAGVAPRRMLAVDDAGHREIVGGQRSPGFAARHPGRPEAARARFTVPRLALAPGAALQLQVEGPRGERAVVAEVRRRWRPPGGSGPQA